MTEGPRSVVDILPSLRQAGMDSVTRLPTREAFFTRLDYILVEATKRLETFALISVDIDKFSLINGSFGNDAGDHLLMIVASRLAEMVRENDMIARAANDSFVIALRNLAGREEAATIARKMLRRIAAPICYQNYQLQITASMGVTMFPVDGREVGLLKVNSDLALSEARRRGDGKLAFFSRERSRKARETVLIISALRGALVRDELEVHYQPIINAKSRQVASAEALVRWKSPTLGLVPPATFIPLAEEIDVITSIGEWMLERACLDAASWQKLSTQPVSVAVNLSARQARGDLSSMKQLIERSLTVSGLPPHLLKFELTESCFIENHEGLFAWAQWLRGRDIQLSIDDFGTGYSNLSYLRDLPSDNVKIDQSFIAGMRSSSGATLVMALIQMLHTLGKKVVAEGVETAAQFDFLAENGCDFVQGYLFQKPIPANEFAAYLQRFDPSVAA